MPRVDEQTNFQAILDSSASRENRAGVGYEIGFNGVGLWRLSGGEK